MHIALSITEGRTVRDLFHNGLLRDLTDAGATVAVFTEAVHVKPFIEEWSLPGVSFHMLYPCHATIGRARAWRMRYQIARLKCRPLLKLYRAWENRKCYSPRPEYLEQFRSHRPDVFLSTHSQLPAEAEVLNAARICGIPTVGMIRSWDNVLKGIRCNPDRMVVWNEINQQELMAREGYSKDDTVITGAPQFDCHFQDDAVWDRARFCRQFDLDPSRPYILFATNGYYEPGFDETCWMESLLELIDNGTIHKRPQVICRLHPWSRLEHFQQFGKHPDVRLSFVEKYLPALTWCMNRDDMVVMANMLRHADVVITPGSTITLEAAIFDRPSLVPVYHPYQPDRAVNFFKRTLGQHYARLVQQDLVPIIRDAADYPAVINRYLEDPSWYRDARLKLVRDYAYFTDGRSTERLVKLVLDTATNSQS